MCNECPLSITLLESRWRLFGHILRRNSEIPANKSMNSYFISHGGKFRGRPLTTLPVVLNKDLTRVSDDKLQLTSLKDLEHLRSVTQNRQTWRKLKTRIREADEVSPLILPHTISICRSLLAFFSSFKQLHSVLRLQSCSDHAAFHRWSKLHFFFKLQRAVSKMWKAGRVKPQL